ncbi:MAG: hypothetical protein ACYDGM_11350 [Vulcanimicrobiaceae bacterium]
MHLVLAVVFHIVMNGTIAVHVRNPDSGERGVYVQRIHDASVTIDRGILQFEAPAEYTATMSQPACTGRYGDPRTPIQGSIFLTATAQREFLGSLLAPGQLVGMGTGSSAPCGSGFAARLPTGLVPAPHLPSRPGSVTHWRFSLRGVHDAMPGIDNIYRWGVNLTFRAKP